MATTIDRQSKRARFTEIMRVFREYSVLTNLARQRHPEQVRRAFEVLGPTFIKIGQLLASRPDMVSPAFAQELRQLQDAVAPDDFATVEATIQAATGRPIAETYQSFDPVPFASASMGQTHHAVLKSGQSVVVKVHHPHIQDDIDRDLGLFEQALPLLRILPESRVLDLNDMVAQLRQALTAEVDTLQEVHNGQRFYDLNNGDGVILVPQVDHTHSVQDALVNQDMAGTSINQFIEQLSQARANHDPHLEEWNHQAKQYADVLVHSFMKQVFTDGFFHADLHGGNILLQRPAVQNVPVAPLAHSWAGQPVGSATTAFLTQSTLPDYRLVLLDFGMMGSISSQLMAGLADIVIAVSAHDTHRVGQGILALSHQTGPVDETRFLADLGPLLAPYYQSGLGDIDFQQFAFSVITVCRQNHLQINPDVTLLMKGFGTLEGLIQVLDPSLSMIEVAGPFAIDYLRDHLDVKTALATATIDSLDSLKAVPKLPSRLLAVLETFDSGKAAVTLYVSRREQLLDRIEAMVNRMVIAIILAAVIVGSSLLVEGHPANRWLTLLGTIGYVGALSILAILLLSTIHRWWHHRHD